MNGAIEQTANGVAQPWWERAPFLYGIACPADDADGRDSALSDRRNRFFVGFALALIKWIALREPLIAPFRQSLAAWTIGVGGLFGYHFLLFLAL